MAVFLCDSGGVRGVPTDSTKILRKGALICGGTLKYRFPVYSSTHSAGFGNAYFDKSSLKSLAPGVKFFRGAIGEQVSFPQIHLPTAMSISILPSLSLIAEDTQTRLPFPLRFRLGAGFR